MDGAQPLVGRRAELAFLTDVLIAGTRPRVVVLVGEAGVGKTRLIAEAVRRARAAGVKVLLGSCLPLTDSVPFLPLTEALRGLGPAGGKPGPADVLERCEPHVRAELARLVPGWNPAPQPAERGSVEGWQRGRLFSALRDLLAALAAEGRCALVVEDLHWADTTTLDFLAYLCAVDRGGSTPLVLTCREEEIEARRPVGPWFAELGRQAGVVHLPLDRLTRAEVAEQIRGLLDAAPAAAFVDQVYARAEGNAFFTEQLVAAGAGRVALPTSLAQLLIAKAETVGEDGWAVLTALAVAGRGLDETLLTSITGLTGRRLRTAVRELSEARLVDRPGVDHPGAEGRYRLRHALVGEAVAADMLTGDRRERHATVARVLTSCAAAEGSGEVAEHWAAADELSEEMPWRLAAAAEAEHVYAYREAARHWQRVIDLWVLVPPGVRPADLDLAAVHLKAIDALDRCGDTKRAGLLAEQALRTLGPAADRRRLAVLYERTASYLYQEDDPTAQQPLEVALQLLADLPPGREHATVLRSYAEQLYERGRTAEARFYLEQARQACTSDAPAHEQARILCTIALISFDDGDVSAGMRLLDRAVALAERDDDDIANLVVADVRCWALLQLGRLEDVVVATRAGLARARRAGLEQHTDTQLLLSFLADAVSELGRPADVVSEVQAVTEAPPTSGASYDHMTRAYLDTLAGDLTAATTRWAMIEEASHRSNLRYGGNLVERGAMDLWAHRPAAALRRIQDVPEGIHGERYRDFIGPILTTALRACADLAETARADRHTAWEQAARRAAESFVELHDAMGFDPFAALRTG